MLHNEDQAEDFGKWGDETSKLMYHDVMPLALLGVDVSGNVADLGGANGLLKEWVPQAITVDYDISKSPDICADILAYRGKHDLLVIRYVLHYMNDQTVIGFMRHIAGYHDGPVLIIQFVNDDLVSKHANSIGEIKWFRDENHLRTLLENDWVVAKRRAVGYVVDADFYRNRLKHPNPSSHDEEIVIYELTRK